MAGMDDIVVECVATGAKIERFENYFFFGKKKRLPACGAVAFLGGGFLIPFSQIKINIIMIF